VVQQIPAQPSQNGQSINLYTGSYADACKTVPSMALANFVLKALVEGTDRTVAVEAFQELVSRLRALEPQERTAP
jgi:hypothetical protein